MPDPIPTEFPHDKDCEGYCDQEQVKLHAYADHEWDRSPRCAGWRCVEHDAEPAPAAAHAPIVRGEE